MSEFVNKFSPQKLPEPLLYEGVKLNSHGKYIGTEDGYTVDQMRAYGEACAAAEREACATLLDQAAEWYMSQATDKNNYLTTYGRETMLSAANWAWEMAGSIRARGEACDAGPWGPCPTPSACKCPPREEI